MRRLTVKNFSVIKEAELEFGKITVLIGPQASGKSLLCKLSYFLTKQTIELALRSILGPEPLNLTKLEQFRFETLVEFLKWFPIDAWYSNDALVAFESERFSVKISLRERLPDIQAEFSSSFEEAFESLSKLIERSQGSGPDFRLRIAEQVRAQLLLLISGPEAEVPYIDRPVFIPDGRGFFADPSLGYGAINSPNLDPILKEFSLEISWGSARAPNPILGPEGVHILGQIGQEIEKILGGRVEGQNGFAKFRRASDGKSIPLPLLSSGTQAILPMFNVLWQTITDQRDRIVFPRPDNLPGLPAKIVVSKGLVWLEDPEANIFPSTQNDLVRLFAWLSSEWRTDFSWVITTHSPYILTAFGNLLKAGKVGYQSPEHHAAVAKTVPEKYWIKNSEFTAYKIENGVLKSIYDESTGQIDADYLDDVSSDIAEEFGQLLEIQYGS
jgi:hypothetical protein